MRTIYALLLSLLGLVSIIFNRFGVEEFLKIRAAWPGKALPAWFLRIVGILAGSFFILFGLLMMMGYLQ